MAQPFSDNNRAENYTNINNVVYDDLMPRLKGTSLKVLLALIRFDGRITLRKLKEYTGISSYETIASAISDLVTNNAIEPIDGMRPNEAKDLLCRKQPQTLGESDETFFPNICAWCECATAHLHAHHWPVPKSEGGTETVDICPNCHMEYHALVDGSSYRLKV